MFKISKAEEQAMRLTLRLAASGQQQTLSDLALGEELPEPTVAKVLGQLRRGGVVDAVRGRHGGYILAGTPKEISARQVLSSVAVDFIAGSPCPKHGNEPCPRNTDCGLRSVWQHLEKTLTEVLDRTTIADLLEKEAKVSAQLQDRWPLTGE